MLRAVRPLSIGEHTLAPEDEVTDEIAALLPPRRLDQLIDQRRIERVSDEAVLTVIETRLAKLEKPRRKVAA